MELIAVQFDKILQSALYTCIVLKTETTCFAIYTDPSVGKTMQKYLLEPEISRPSTHELISLLSQGFEFEFFQVVIYDCDETIFSSRLFAKQHKPDVHIVEIDVRPSDAITLALAHNLPIYCTKVVLDKVVPYQE